MSLYVVLLRGINVGGKNGLPMKQLKSLLEDNGFGNVSTYIQSGNIVVTYHKKPDTDVSVLIETKFGFAPAILVLTKKQFDLSVSNNPFQQYEGKLVHTYFCKNTAKLNMTKLEKLASVTETYQLIDNVFYLYAPDGIARSKLVANIEACLGVTATGRNLNTINKLKAMLNNIE